MADHYIENQKKIIRRQVSKFLPGYITVYFFLFLFIGVFLFTLDPPPQTWETDEITFVDVQYRSKRRTIARYAPDGYELTDQNGNRYWSDYELNWQELGKPYTIKYFMREGYRICCAVSQEDTVILSEADGIAAWKQNMEDTALVLFLCTCILIYVSRSFYKALNTPEIRECRKRIRIHQAKENRRSLEKQRK